MPRPINGTAENQESKICVSSKCENLKKKGQVMPKRCGMIWYSEIAVRENVRKATMDVAGLCESEDGTRYFHPTKHVSRQERYISEHFDEIVDEVLDELITRKFKFGKVRKFTTMEGPKVREINHLDKHGAILLNSVMRVCQHIFIKKYIPFTYSSIKGRGLTDCVKRIQKVVAEHPDWYYYQADAHHCYQNTRHDVALNAIKMVFKDIYVIEFFEQMLSLIDEGLAIGFSPNHYIENMVFSKMDHRMIEKEGYSDGYNRYMDDVLVMAPEEDCIRASKIINEEFRKIHHTIKQNSKIAPVSSGIDYVGYVFYPGYTRLRKRIKLNIKRCDAKLRKAQVSDDKYQAAMASYNGWMKWGDCRHLEKVIYKDKIKLFTKTEKKKMEAVRLSETPSTRTWFGLGHDRFVSSYIGNDNRLYENEFIVLNFEKAKFDESDALVVHIKIDEEEYYTITKSSSLMERIPRAWERVGQKPFLTKLEMRQSARNSRHKYPVLV